MGNRWNRFRTRMDVPTAAATGWQQTGGEMRNRQRDTCSLSTRLPPLKRMQPPTTSAFVRDTNTVAPAASAEEGRSSAQLR
jgi:hypothetical protein